MIFNIVCKTNVGLIRDHNEDNFVIGVDPAIDNWNNIAENYNIGDKGIFVVIADGMGGAEAGEIASEIAIETAKDEFIKKTKEFPKTSFEILNLLKDIIHSAHKNIIANIENNPLRKGMGTTILLSIVYNNHAYIAWIGDSRAYRFNKNGINSNRVFDLDNLEIVTNDHSVVWEYVLSGNMTSEEARLHTHSNIITQSLGNSSKSINPDATIVRLKKNDRLVFCTDGLNSMVSDRKISDILDKDKKTERTCDILIKKALEEGGSDNITVCVLDISEVDSDVIINERSSSVTESTLLISNKSDKISVFSKYGKYIIAFLFLSIIGFSGRYFMNRSNNNIALNIESNKEKTKVSANSDINQTNNIEEVKNKLKNEKRKSPKVNKKRTKNIKKEKTINTDKLPHIIDSLKSLTLNIKDKVRRISLNLNNIKIDSLNVKRIKEYNILNTRIKSLNEHILTYYNFNDNSFSIRYNEIIKTNCIYKTNVLFEYLNNLYNNFINSLTKNDDLSDNAAPKQKAARGIKVIEPIKLTTDSLTVTKKELPFDTTKLKKDRIDSIKSK